MALRVALLAALTLQAGCTPPQQQLLRTKASFFIEASAMLSRRSPLHGRLWAGVAAVRAPQVMYMPWAPYPRYAVPCWTPPTNGGARPCKASWNFTLFDEMVDDYLAATAYDRDDDAPYFAFSQSPCWLWRDGDCPQPPPPPSPPPPPGAGCTVSLSKQESKVKCTAGQSYGCTGNATSAAVWVLGGCRGQFMCNGGGASHRSLECASDAARKATCPCNKQQQQQVAQEGREFHTPSTSYSAAGDPDPNELGPSHKAYAAGVVPRAGPGNYTEVADFFGRLASYLRSGAMTDECGAVHTRPGGAVAVRWWSVNNEGEHARSPAAAIQLYDAIVAGIARFETGGEHPLRYVGVNQNTGGSPGLTASWLTAFMDRSLHAAGTQLPDMVGFHGYFHGLGGQAQHHARGANANANADANGAAAPPAAAGGSVCDSWGAGTAGPAAFEAVFDQVDAFVKSTIDTMVRLRREHFPDTLLSLGEWGVEPQHDIDSACDQAVARDPMYQLAAAGVMGYGYGAMAERGIDLVLQSQYTGHAAGTPFTGELKVLLRNYYPGLALYNWTTGALQPRSVINQVLSAHLDVGSDAVLLPSAAHDTKVNASCCAPRPRTTPSPGNFHTRGDAWSLLWADMNAATPPGARGAGPSALCAGHGGLPPRLRVDERCRHTAAEGPPRQQKVGPAACGRRRGAAGCGIHSVHH